MCLNVHWLGMSRVLWDQTPGREMGLCCPAELIFTTDTVLGLSSTCLRPPLGCPWSIFLGKHTLLQLRAIWAF